MQDLVHIRGYSPYPFTSVLCKGSQVFPQGEVESYRSFLKTDCIECAKIKYRQLISQGDMIKAEMLGIRFKLKPRDLL